MNIVVELLFLLFHPLILTGKYLQFIEPNKKTKQNKTIEYSNTTRIQGIIGKPVGPLAHNLK